MSPKTRRSTIAATARAVRQWMMKWMALGALVVLIVLGALCGRHSDAYPHGHPPPAGGMVHLHAGTALMSLGSFSGGHDD